MTKLRQIYHQIKPYYIIVHPPSGNAAVYNRKYEKMSEWASSRLIDYAINHHTQVTNGLKPMDDPHQRPSWMTPGMEADCVGYHTYNDKTSTERIGNIPEEY